MRRLLYCWYALVASAAFWNWMVAMPFEWPLESYESEADLSGPTVEVKSSCEGGGRSARGAGRVGGGGVGWGWTRGNRAGVTRREKRNAP